MSATTAELPGSDASFREMASALAELGLTSQQVADTELMADRLRRSGWTEAHAELAIYRMRLRMKAFSDAQRFLSRAETSEELVRLITQESPPPWRTIVAVSWSLIRARLRGEP